MPELDVVPELVVVTAAEGSYLPYALPYATSVLHHNPDCVVEIFVRDRAAFRRQYQEGLTAIGLLFGDRLILTEVEFISFGSIVRFVQHPLTRARYVYIGDIDILVLEQIAPIHLEIMRRHGLRYSNEVRSSFQQIGLNKMTGLHFSDYDFYYPVSIPDDIDMKSLKWNSDEDLLFRIMSAKTELRLGNIGRPVHGFHVSQHGWPFNQWGVQHKNFRDMYNQFRKSSSWTTMRPFFDPRYLVYLEILEAAVKGYGHFSSEEIKQSSALYGRGAQTHLK